MTLFYLDPPYMPATRTAKREYRHEMTDEDHVDLLNRIMTLQGMVALSGYRHDLYDEALEGWARHDRLTSALTSVQRTESLWLSPNAIAAGGGGRQGRLALGASSAGPA